MNTSIAQTTFRSVSEIYEQSTLKKLVDARNEFGEGSIEFQEAHALHQAESARIEAEYQTAKAAHQAWLYEQGY